MGRQRRDTKLDRVYFDPERVGSYGGVDALHRATGEVPKRTAKRWLLYPTQTRATSFQTMTRRSRRSKPAVAGRSRRRSESEKIQRRYKVPIDGNRRFLETGMVRSVK